MWHPAWNLIRILPVLFLLALLWLPENRGRSAWLVALPFVATIGGATLFTLAAPHFDGYQTTFVGRFAWAFGLAQTCTWLMLARLRTRWRALSSLVFLVSLTGLSLATELLDQMVFSLDDGTLVLFSAVWYVVVGLTISAGLFLASFACRKRYTRLRFTLSLTLAVLVAALAILGLAALAQLLDLGITPVEGLRSLSTGDLEAGMLALVLAGAAAGIMLPFVVFTFLSPTYHARFQRTFHLGALAVEPAAAPGVTHVEPASTNGVSS